jgi:hypothetical protein
MNNSKLTREIEISEIRIDNENYFKISNSDEMRPFFMSIVSNSNHWMFISSNGGLTAGRKNAEFSLFPYYTDDKITESADITGSKSIFRITSEDHYHLWEPFSERFEGRYSISRNLYKNVLGNKVIFEEINHDLKLSFQYQWASSNSYGFVKKSSLKNNSQVPLKIEILDGIQNILPYGVGSYLQNQTSNLVDAYKRSQLESQGLGIFALSAIIVDKAEPSEALKANIAWSIGLENTKYLLSSLQLKKYRRGASIEEENDIKAEKGAYFVNAETILSSNESKEWMIVTDVNKNHSTIKGIIHQIKEEKNLDSQVIQDIKKGADLLIALNAASDGLQRTADNFRDTRHFSNTLFNIMRGGIFDYNYQIEKEDFRKYIKTANKKVLENLDLKLIDLGDEFTLTELMNIAGNSIDSDFKRLCYEYLPLKFSRRHGDPSRPWNKFSINTQSEIDGSKILDYEGNWRDIFQNWEALAYSFPDFVTSMIHKFLNASTFDGYNPYRVTKDGFDWETIEPDDPWSYIGYWGDHQIIYLLKLLEIQEKHEPGKLEEFFNKDIFVYANVPYKIKDYKSLLADPKDTIEFDEELDEEIKERRDNLGADGALLTDVNQKICKVNFVEKILASVLAKLSNFVPGGGIWMNTQRPEWNDANNALVGNGVSMVTLYYLRRFLSFFTEILSSQKIQDVEISEELYSLFEEIKNAFEISSRLLETDISNSDRKSLLDSLGTVAGNFRSQVYTNKFTGRKLILSLVDLKEFMELCNQFLEHSIDLNKKDDNMFHAYNLLTLENDEEISISYLSEMLEGQVAVLSSGYLSAEQALNVLDGLKQSKLFREDQYSYILYPNKDLPLFLEKNNIPRSAVDESPLLSSLGIDNNSQIVNKDVNGDFHFNGNFKNANDLETALSELSETKYKDLVESDKNKVLQIFEDIFNHKSFTGRSGTFYGYEGLGSIYWHMVSKLNLAVMECCIKAIQNNSSDEVIGKLLDHYYEINAGIGVHKPPSLYGAFPTDPYSHTPGGKGAQQPGMTGQVKEDILVRFGELGVFVEGGKILFNPLLLKKEEFLSDTTTFEYVDVFSEKKQVQLEKDSLCFTYCQIPIVYKISDKRNVKVVFKNYSSKDFEDCQLDKDTSGKIFNRIGDVIQIEVHIEETQLR